MYSVDTLLAAGVSDGHSRLYASWFEYIQNPAFAKNKVQLILFLAQTLYESAYFTRNTENIRYSRERACQVWPKHTNAIMQLKERDYKGIINIVYGNRMGNVKKNDGYIFIGRGLIQLTGRNNYTQCATDLGLPYAENLVTKFKESPIEYSILTAYWFWSKYVINRVEEVLCNDTTLEGCCNAATYAINRHTDSYFKRAQLAEKVKNILT